MASPSRRDLKLALDFVHGLQDTDDLDLFARTLLRELPNLVKCDIVGFNEVSPKLGRFHSIVSPSIDNLDTFEQTWLLHQHEHPTYQHVLQSGDGTAHRISDFMARREFFRTGIYGECYRAIGCNAQISVAFDAPPGVVVALAFNRRRGDFSDRDRDVLNLLRPHLSKAYARVGQSASLKANHLAADLALEALDVGLFALDSGGKLAWSTERARSLFNDYTGPPRGSDPLPAQVRAWTAQRRSEPTVSLAPLVLRAGSRSLTVRPLPGGPFGLSLFQLKEHQPILISPDQLQRMFGLTTREAEVLLAIVHGRTTPEIAAGLGCRPRTAQKHTENLFRKLKVSTRTAAVMAAMQVALV